MKEISAGTVIMDDSVDNNNPERQGNGDHHSRGPHLNKSLFDKEGRIIIRNLPFDVKDIHLQKEFAKFGEIINVNVPIKNENNLNRGFGFVEYKSKEQAQKAVESMNGFKFKGRTIAVEFSVSKKKYELKVNNILSNTNLQREEIMPKVLKQDKEEETKKK